MKYQTIHAGLVAVIALACFASSAYAYRDLETGTFLTRDPAGFVDGPNVYSYVRQNPWTFFDPLGLAMGPSNETLSRPELSITHQDNPWNKLGVFSARVVDVGVAVIGGIVSSNPQNQAISQQYAQNPWKPFKAMGAYEDAPITPEQIARDADGYNAITTAMAGRHVLRTPIRTPVVVNGASTKPNVSIVVPGTTRPIAATGGKMPAVEQVKLYSSNPQTLWGQSARSIAEAFTGAGYKATVVQSTRGSGRAQIVRIEGHAEISQIQVHPGGGRHSGSYVKVSTSDRGIVKVVDPKTYKADPKEKATILNKPQDETSE